MNQTDLKLYELLGDKTLSSECSNATRSQEPTIADLHTYLNESPFEWRQEFQFISIDIDPHVGFQGMDIRYDPSKSLLLQSEETKSFIISLITSHS